MQRFLSSIKKMGVICMYKFKKLLAGLMLAVTGLGVVSGSTAVFAEEETAAESVSILVPGYDTGYLQAELDAGIEAFTAESGIAVEVLPVGWDELNTRIVQLAQANQSPDILLIGTRSLRQFSEEGIIRSLDEFITPEFVEPRVESVFNTANIGGVQYGVPMAFSSRALVYRTDLIESAPTNWEELLATAQDVKANHDINGFYLPFDGSGTSIELMNFFYQNEAEPVTDDGAYNVNSPEVVETAEYLKQFVDEDLVPNPLDAIREDQIQMFINGDLAMFVTGPWDQELLEENQEEYPFAVAALPEGKQPAVNIATDSYVITEGAQNPEGAWEFIEFMGQEEYQRPISEAFNWFPILTAEEADERFQTDFMQPFMETIPYGQPDPHTSSWDEFHKAFVLALQETVTGAKDAQTAFDEAQNTLEQ